MAIVEHLSYSSQCPVYVTILFNNSQSLEEEETMTPEQLAIKNVGKQASSFCN